MWDHIINIYPSKLLSTKTKKFVKKKKVLHNNFLKMHNLQFIYNNILTKVFKELTKYKNNYQ